MRCVRLQAIALFLLLSAPSSSADFATLITAVKRSALAECRTLYLHVSTIVGEKTWAVERLRESTRGHRERVVPRGRNAHDSEGPRVDSDSPPEDATDRNDERIVLTLAALGIGDGPDATAMLALGGVANYGSDDMGDEFGLRLGLSEEELILALDDIPAVALRMADALIAFSDGVSRLAMKLASLFSKSSGEDWAAVFANRADLRSSRAKQVRHITKTKAHNKTNDNDEDQISTSMKKVVRSSFKIFLGVCIGLIFLMFMRQRS